ncbi:MAG: 16S rRNA (cytidine(1402)-2'-O)-methyltransferase [Hydrogenibacillus schlegelii]|nr:16S rRNA (cytidine(1402)-2'-O)-methyltransferase [Hydrogenibacillus schlegelii]
MADVHVQKSFAATGGVLYVVGTPIGHLDDFTRRAQSVLASVDLIAAEDTRVTRKLLQAYGIRTPLVSFHAHSGPGRLQALVERLVSGASVALVTDAGMPAISDPGEALVRAAIHAGIPVVPIPGPSAAIAALSVSGLPATPFLFVGFLPRRPAERRERLAALKPLPFTLVFYEAPHRLPATLRDLVDVLGPRSAVVAREMTKRHETFWRGKLPDLWALAEKEPPRGEITLVVEGAEAADGRRAAPAGGAPAGEESPGEEAPAEALRVLLAAGFSGRDAARAVAERFGLSRRTAYRLLADLDRAGALIREDED